MLESLLSGTFPVHFRPQSEISLRSPSTQDPDICQHTAMSDAKSAASPISDGQLAMTAMSDGQPVTVPMSDGMTATSPVSDGILSRQDLEMSQNTPTSGGQSAAVPKSGGQSEACLAPGTPALACGTACPAVKAQSPSAEQPSGAQAQLPRSTQLLQINVNQVLGLGSTGTVFAGTV